MQIFAVVQRHVCFLVQFFKSTISCEKNFGKPSWVHLYHLVVCMFFHENHAVI